MNKIPKELHRLLGRKCTLLSVFHVLRNAALLLYAMLLKEVVNAAMTGEMKRVLISVACFTGAFVLHLLATRFTTVLTKKHKLDAEYHIRRVFLKKMDTIPLERIRSYETGEIAVRFQDEAERIAEIYVSAIPDFVRNMSFLVLFVIYAALQHPIFLLVVVLLLPLIYFVTKAKGKRIEQLSEKDAKLNAERNTLEYDVVQNRVELMCYRATQYIAKRLYGVENAYADNAILLMKQNVFLWALSVFTFVGINMFIYSAGAVLAFKGSISFGALLSFFAVLDPVVDSLFSLPYSMGGLFAVKPLLERLTQWLAEPDERQDGAGIEARDKMDVDLHDVEFAYADQLVVRTGNIAIEQGEKVLLVGKSGSGKSTLLKLLSGELAMQRGEILLGDRNVREINPEQLRKEMHFIGAETYIPAGTVLEIFGAFYPNIAPAMVQEMLEIVELNRLTIYERVEADGANLSGGERQRLCMALSLVRRRSLLLGDEALSMVPQEVQVRIMKRIFERQGLTVLWADHRTGEEIQKLFDRIMVVDEMHNARIGTVQDMQRDAAFLELMAQRG